MSETLPQLTGAAAGLRSWNFSSQGLWRVRDTSSRLGCAILMGFVARILGRQELGVRSLLHQWLGLAPAHFIFHPPFSPTPRLLVHPSSHTCGDPVCFDRTHALRATILRTRLPSLCASFTWRSSSLVRSLLAHEGEGRSSGRARGRGGGGDGEICPSCWEEQATMWRVEPCARLDVACMRVLT